MDVLLVSHIKVYLSLWGSLEQKFQSQKTSWPINRIFRVMSTTENRRIFRAETRSGSKSKYCTKREIVDVMCSYWVFPSL